MNHLQHTWQAAARRVVFGACQDHLARLVTMLQEHIETSRPAEDGELRMPRWQGQFNLTWVVFLNARVPGVVALASAHEVHCDAVGSQ